MSGGYKLPQPRDPDQPGVGRLSAKSDAGILAEWRFWNDRIVNARWGAAVTAALEFRRDAAREMRRRHLAVPTA